MTYSTNNRDATSSHSPHCGLLIEGPQILHGTTTATNYEHINQLLCVEKPDGSSYFLGSTLALHQDRVQIQLDARITTSRDSDDIVYSCTGGRCDDANALCITRKSLLALLVKQALASQLRL